MPWDVGVADCGWVCVQCEVLLERIEQLRRDMATEKSAQVKQHPDLYHTRWHTQASAPNLPAH